MENIEGWERFSLAHPFLNKLCEVILHGDSDFPLYSDGSWSPEEFVYCIITLQRSLSYFKDAFVKIQGKNKDIVSGVLTRNVLGKHKWRAS